MGLSFVSIYARSNVKRLKSVEAITDEQSCCKLPAFYTSGYVAAKSIDSLLTDWLSYTQH